MKDSKAYMNEILEILSGVDDTWILEVIHRFVVGMTRGEGQHESN